MKSKPRKSTRPKKAPAAIKQAVQISIDPALLRRIDADSEVRAAGRSAFMVNAALRYLRDKENRRIDEQFRTALSGKADELYAEVEPFLAGQVWPDENDLSQVEDQSHARNARRRSAGMR